jgi:hypothetical protein
VDGSLLLGPARNGQWLEILAEDVEDFVIFLAMPVRAKYLRLLPR